MIKLMDSLSEDECLALPYGTPSPYKERRPRNLPTKERIDNLKKLDKRLEELDVIERKYKEKLLGSNYRVEGLSSSENVSVVKHVALLIKRSFHSSNQIDGIIQSSELNNLRFKNYFHPDHYFNKFNQDNLGPSRYFKCTCYRNMSLIECLQLITTYALVIPEDPVGKENTVKFLLYIGSVTDNVTLSKKISHILGGCHVNFADFQAIIENWGRIDSKAIAKKTNSSPPKSHNFKVIFDLITSSIEHYSVFETKELFKFLIEVSLDPLLNGSTSYDILLEPVTVCIKQLIRYQVQMMDLVDIVDCKDWHICQVHQVVLLLLNCATEPEIGIILGVKTFTKFLSESPFNITEDKPITIKTLSQTLLDGKKQLFQLDFNTAYQLCLLFELFAFRMPNRKEFNISPVINLLEKFNQKFYPGLYSTYITCLISRLKTLSLK